MYNYIMNYFFNELKQGNAKIFMAAGLMALWAVGIIDLFSGGIWGRKFILIPAALNFFGPILYIIGKSIHDRIEGKRATEAIQSYDMFEAKREIEIRDLVARHPNYDTHCYKCIHHHPEKLHCKRVFSKYPNERRIKEIAINKKKYCLYYQVKVQFEAPENIVRQEVEPDAPQQGNERLSEKYRGIK